MASDLFSPPLGLSARFDREVEQLLAQDPTQPAKHVFFEVWQRLKPEYEAMHQALNQHLSRQLEENSIRATLHGRVKKDDSISKSIDRRQEFHGKEYDNPGLIRNAIHDLIGFRIVVDYPSGLNQSYQLIKKRFSIEGVNTFSSDREVGVLWKPRFGAYEGRNFQVRMSPDKSNGELSAYYEVLFEVQVTSIAESLYNRLAHPLHYKKSSGTLSRQDEMIIDMSHGLSLCYWITIACMEEKLESDSETSSQKSPIPDTVRTIAGRDPEDTQVDMDGLADLTPELPVISGDRSLIGSKSGSSSMKRTAPTEDTISREQLLRLLFDLPRENRSDEDIWRDIRDRLGLDDGTYMKFLKSFTYDRMNERKNSIQQRHQNTFEWVFGNEKLSTQDRYGRAVKVPNLANWLEEDRDCLYWVSGKPGSGKSFFMKFIEKDERVIAAIQRWQPNCRIISHYLWKPGSNDQHSFKGVICSLLHQILQDEKAVALRLLRETSGLCHKNDASDWDVEDLKKLLFKVLDRAAHAYLVLIDGLDEMSRPHDGMSQLFSFLDDLAKLERVKVCISSRPETPFVNRFKSQPSLRMQDLTRNDIRKYTVDKLSQLDIEIDDEKFQKATDVISYRAEGVFIWVYIVLKEIQQDVDELDEGWDDILNRISKLPSDLMTLYRDMLSRVGFMDEKHVKRAALYFQYIQNMPRHIESNIATLSLAADETILESFTGPENVPCADEWVQLCEKAEKTLFRITAGLLEIRIHKYLLEIVPSEDKTNMMPWMAKEVHFIHRTAIDFLESVEGKHLFGAYAKTPKCMLNIYVKAQLARYSVVPDLSSGLRGVIEILPAEYDAEYSSCVSNDILSVIHACSVDKPNALIHPPHFVSCENFFITFISYRGFYKWAQDLIKVSGNYNLKASTYALFGACELSPSIGAWTAKCHLERCKAIIVMLKHVSRLLEHSTQDSSTRQGATKVIMWAWRTFLFCEASLATLKSIPGGHRQLITDILRLFIKLGVMHQVSQPKYLVEWNRIGMFKFISDKDWLESYTPVIYIETNDAWFLDLLTHGMPITQELREKRENAFIRILVARGARGPGKVEAEYFLINKYEVKPETAADSLKELDSISRLIDDKSDHLHTTSLGHFEGICAVLEKIGYDLPDINMVLVDCREFIYWSNPYKPRM
ncbi:hypothetical protein FPOAC2_07249 [Fusarium poae]